MLSETATVSSLEIHFSRLKQEISEIRRDLALTEEFRARYGPALDESVFFMRRLLDSKEALANVSFILLCF
jgi:hypothetical protein